MSYEIKLKKYYSEYEPYFHVMVLYTSCNVDRDKNEKAIKRRVYLGGLTETKRLIPFINKPKNGNVPYRGNEASQ